MQQIWMVDFTNVPKKQIDELDSHVWNEMQKKIKYFIEDNTSFNPLDRQVGGVFHLLKSPKEDWLRFCHKMFRTNIKLDKDKHIAYVMEIGHKNDAHIQRLTFRLREEIVIANI